jgi:3-phenylpropionate/cinnamic acid dioxygenase small subunit
MTDEAAITRLLYQYARAVDTKDWELYRSVFTDDAVIDYSSAGIAAGPRDGEIAKSSKTTIPSSFGEIR